MAKAAAAVEMAAAAATQKVMTAAMSVKTAEAVEASAEWAAGAGGNSSRALIHNFSSESVSTVLPKQGTIPVAPGP